MFCYVGQLDVLGMAWHDVKELEALEGFFLEEYLMKKRIKKPGSGLDQLTFSPVWSKYQQLTKVNFMSKCDSCKLGFLCNMISMFCNEMALYVFVIGLFCNEFENFWMLSNEFENLIFKWVPSKLDFELILCKANLNLDCE